MSRKKLKELRFEGKKLLNKSHTSLVPLLSLLTLNLWLGSRQTKSCFSSLSGESFKELRLKIHLFKFEVLRNSRARLNFFSFPKTLPFLLALSLVTISLWPCSRLKGTAFDIPPLPSVFNCSVLRLMCLQLGGTKYQGFGHSQSGLTLINILVRFRVKLNKILENKFIINKFIISGSFQMSFSKYTCLADLFIAARDECDAKYLLSQLFTRN